MVGDDLLEDTQGFSLEKEPLSGKEFLDLSNIVKDGFVQFLRVQEKAFVLEEGEVLGNDCILCDNGELGLFVVFPLLVSFLFKRSATLRLFLIILFLKLIQLILLLIIVILPVLFLPLEQLAGLDGEHFPLRVGRQQPEELIGDLDHQRYHSIMCNVMEAYPQDLSDVVAENICHEYVCVFSLAHVHRVGDFPDDIKIGTEKLQSCMEEVYLELLFLLTIGLTSQNLVNELKMSILHDIYDPAEAKLHLVFLHITLSLCAFFVVLGPDHLQRPTAEQQVLNHIIVSHFGSLLEDAIEDQLHQLLKFHL